MILERNWACIFCLASALLGIAAVSCPVVQAASLVIINNDASGQGLNDATPAAPAGGNTGTTVGAQRLIAFQYAADFWGARLSSSVTIQVGASFSPLTCSSTSALLGHAAPFAFFRDFIGALVAGTWYPVGLANALSGSDLDPSNPDITAQFNSAIGTTCPFPGTWYYGLDGNPPAGQIDFVTVLLHELAHGLGFLTVVDLASGSKALGFNDTFMLNLENHLAMPSDYPSMTDAQRVAASTATGNLHWVGTNVEFSYSLSAVSGSLKYSITNVPSWLTASPRSGTVTTRATSVTFRINPTTADRLSVGTNISNINFNDTTNNQVTTRAATLIVTPKSFTVKVSASPIADGTVTGGGTFAGGTSDTVTATPNSGHTFVHWTENGSVVSTSESYTFTVSTNVTLVADFK